MANRVRAAVRSWLDELDVTERNRLIPLLDNGDDRIHASTFAELVVGAWLNRCGAVCERHPELPNGKRPDFLASLRGECVLVEVVSSFGEPEQTTPNVRRRERLAAAIEERLRNAPATRYLFLLEVFALPTKDFSATPIARRLSHWIAEDCPVDPETGERAIVVPLQDGSGYVQLSVEPDVEQPQPRDPAVLVLQGVTFDQMAPITPEKTLLQALGAKATKYRPDMPLVVVTAVPATPHPVRWPEDPIITLFGNRYGSFSIAPDGRPRDLVGRTRSGLFFDRKATDVSGVVFVSDALPSRFLSSQALWVANPWARRPAPEWIAEGLGTVQLDETMFDTIVDMKEAGHFARLCGVDIER